MTTGNPAAARAKVVNGTLRHDALHEAWSGKGSGQSCDGCEQAIVATDFEIEADFLGGQALRFHAECFTAWQRAAEERRARAGG